MTDISVVIVNWNTRALLQACLASLYEQTPHSVEMEVIVVDNASDDDSVAMVKREFPQVVLIENNENVGFGRANNQGFAHCQGDIVFCLNSDTIVYADTLTEILAAFRAQPQVAAVGCALFNEDGSRQPSIYRFPTPGTFLYSDTLLGSLGLFKRQYRHYKWRDFDYGRAQAAQHIKAAAIAVRKDALDALEGFDRDFFMYYEDLDLCYRLHQAGYGLWYQPSARVLHYGKASSKQIWQQAFIADRLSLLKYLRKHNGRGWGRVFFWVYKPLVLLNAAWGLVSGSLKVALAALTRHGRRERYLQRLKARWWFLTTGARRFLLG